MVIVVSLSGSLMSSAGQEEEFNQPTLRPVSKWADQVVAQFAKECAQKNYYFSQSVAEQVAALVEAACVFAKVDKQKKPVQVATSFKNLYINIADAIQENAQYCSKVCPHVDYQKAFVESIVLVPDDILKRLIRSKGNFAGMPELETIYAIKQRVYQMVEKRLVCQMSQFTIASERPDIDSTLARALATFVHKERKTQKDPEEQLLKHCEPPQAFAVSPEKLLVYQIAKQEIQAACTESGRIFSEELFDEITIAMHLVLVEPENDSEKLIRKEYIFNYYKHLQQSVVDYAKKHELILFQGAYYEYELKFLNSLKQVNLELTALMFQGKDIKRGNDQLDFVFNYLTMCVMHKLIELDKKAHDPDQVAQEDQPAQSEVPSVVKSVPSSSCKEELFDAKVKAIYSKAKVTLDSMQQQAKLQGAEVTEKSWKMIVMGMMEAYKGIDVHAIPNYADRFVIAVGCISSEVDCLIKKYKKDFLSLGVDLSDYEEMFDLILCAATKSDLVKVKGVKAGCVSDDRLSAFLKQLESAVLENLKEARTQKRAFERKYNKPSAQRVEKSGRTRTEESVNGFEPESAKPVSRQVQKKQTERAGSEVKITSGGPSKKNNNVGIEKKSPSAPIAKKAQPLHQESEKVTTGSSNLTQRQQVALLKKAEKELCVAIANVDGPGVLSRREMRRRLRSQEEQKRSTDDVSQVSSAVATEVQQAVANVVASCSTEQTEVGRADQEYGYVAGAPAASSSPAASPYKEDNRLFPAKAYRERPDSTEAVRYKHDPYSSTEPFVVEWIHRVDSALKVSGQAQSNEALGQPEQRLPRVMVRGRGIVGGSR